MRKLLGFVLEIFRITLIFGILGALGWEGLIQIYTFLGAAETYSWSGAIGIVMIMFILYRNKWQFRGWMKTKNTQKLSKRIVISIAVVALLSIAAPIVLGFFMSE
ncbi:MAG: hypothetical protein H0Z32_04845 [Bacillaceae bacterium]|nr:hypothetical protein [Bacillaceae bacterium]